MFIPTKTNIMKNSPQNTPQKSSHTLFGIICHTFGHSYLVSRKVTNHINEYKCSHCGKEVTDTFTGTIEPLTHKTKMQNSSLAAFFQKKSKRRLTA